MKHHYNVWQPLVVMIMLRISEITHVKTRLECHTKVANVNWNETWKFKLRVKDDLSHINGYKCEVFGSSCVVDELPVKGATVHRPMKAIV